ncbi:unnamed protein product [Moneuplotes crassus]|uniref:Uncharacterized protein n=1 Tax=Euplotes crassus TaxID=5936 RepID=A0AAD1UEU9_EUPCR|nr:unnamed protein product [Moneuplotes crassus]
MKIVFITLLVLALTSARLYQNKFEELRQAELFDSFGKAYEYTQKLDHFNPQNKETFAQRYFDIDKYWDPETGPLFLYICGEGICQQPADNSFVVNLAKKFNGRVVALEHRYYGYSQPKPDWSTENLQFLTPDQGLADLAQFATDKSREFTEQHGIPFRRWITVGGSYPGAMSAWFRAKYPHIAFASLASSAVVNAIKDYHQYDGQIYKSTLKSGEWCPNKYIELIKAFEQAFDEGKADEVFSKIGFRPGDVTPLDFLGFLGNFPAGAVQYGSRRALCSQISEAGDNLDDYINFIRNALNSHNLKIDDFFVGDSTSHTLDPYANMRQWTYQICSNLGYFQTYSRDTPAMRSEQINLDFWRDQCSKEFGVDIFPDTDHWNELYGGKDLVSSRIIFTNGGEDPWQHASVTETDNPTYHTFVIDCDDCAHCVDLYGDKPTDAPEITEARSQIADILEGWIAHELEL